MIVVTVSADVDVPGPPRDLVQRLNSRPAPCRSGLLARHWQVDRHRVRGRYLFDDEAEARAFAARLTDEDALTDLPAELPPEVPVTTSLQEIDLDAHLLHRPVFVVSAPRSGSTLLAETLALAEGVWSMDAEGQAVIDGVPALHPATRGYESQRLTERDVHGQVRSAITAGYLGSLRRRQDGRWTALGSAGNRVRMLDKTPENVLRIPFLHKLFPDARFVFLHRELRPSVGSIVAAWHHPGFTSIADLPGWSRRRWCFLLPRGWRSYDGAPISDVAAFQWRSANEQALDDLEAIPPTAWCAVAYEELVARPEATIRGLCDELEFEVGPELQARLARELPLSATTITAPSPIKWRSDPNVLESSFERLGQVGGRLRALHAGRAALAAPARPADPPREWFTCPLANLDPATGEAGSWVVNPTLRVQLGAAPPAGLTNRMRHRSRFLPDHPILWVENPVTGALDPYWTGQSDAWWVRLLRPGAALPAGLDERLQGQLRQAGILVDGDTPDRDAQPEHGQLAAAAERLLIERYAVLPELVRPAQRSAYAAYYQRLIDSGKWAVGDGQVSQRYGWHDEPMARFLHHQLTTLVGTIAGKPVKPTYCYASSYCGGASLDAHTDREQCEFTVSLLIAESAAPDAEPWPLWFVGPTGRAGVDLEPGEAVLFHGCELPHWREAAPPSHQQTMLLFHYVSAGFAGPRD